MPKQSGGKPLLDFKADPIKELKGISVRQSLQDQLDKYALYVEQSGETKPTRSAVADKVFEYFFTKDAGFQAFLKSPKAKTATTAPAGQT
jgi:hypothetical protein